MLTIVGLGNPSAAYEKTRHNAGFMLLDEISGGRFIERAEFNQSRLEIFKRWGNSGRKSKKPSGPYVAVEGELSGKQFILIKPATFMNESGKAIASLITRGILTDLSELLVIVDDVDLMLGRLRLRQKGSSGGHNGLKSIISHIGTTEFSRLRIGVGPRPEGSEMVNHVLGTFLPDEFEILEKSLYHASEVVEAWITGGYENARTILSRIITSNNYPGEAL